MHGSLQERMLNLDSDLPEETINDYGWFNQGTISTVTSRKIPSPRPLVQDYPNVMRDRIDSQTSKTLSLLTATLMKHLNIGQHTIVDTSEVFMSLETASVAALLNRSIVLVANASVRMPHDFQSDDLNSSSTVSLRVRRLDHPLYIGSSSLHCSRLRWSPLLPEDRFNTRRIPICLARCPCPFLLEVRRKCLLP